MLPREIKIGKKCWKIKKKFGLYSREKTFGYIEDEDYEIYIAKELTKNQKGETLLHEILHILEPNMKEIKVDKLAHRLFNVLKNNKLKSNKW